ncbi:MAG: alpha-E domain-containing protein [Aggregatilineales bacterium]
MTNQLMLSNVADNLYWMSRYLERAEHTARLLIVNLNISLDMLPANAQLQWARLFKALNVPVPEGDIDDFAAMEILTFDRENSNSILSCIMSARENARQVRAQISSEMWEHLNEMFLNIKSTSLEKIWNAGPFTFLREIRNGSHMFEGITDSTMNHGEGWHFIQVGRFIERANGIANLLAVHSDVLEDQNADLDNEQYLELLAVLKSCTAFEAYCKIYTAAFKRERITELLLLNPEFPHSIRFAIDCVQSALDNIAEATDKRKTIRTNRLVGRLKAELSFDMIDDVISYDLGNYLNGIRQKCAEIHSSVNETYIAYPVQSALVF